MTTVLPDTYASDHRYELQQAIRRHVTKPDPDAHKHVRALERALGIRKPKPKLKPRKPSPQQIADWIEDVEWLLSQGECAAAIASRFGITIPTAIRRLERAGRQDLAAHLWRYAK